MEYYRDIISADQFNKDQIDELMEMAFDISGTSYYNVLNNCIMALIKEYML